MVDRRIVELGAWEIDQTTALEGYARRCKSLSSGQCIFLDVGAYFGLYSLLMDRTGLFDRIVAFEPDLRNFRQLQAQLFLNNTAERIEVRGEAVSDRSGAGWFTQSETHPTGNRAGISLANGPGSGTRDVRVVAIDDVFRFEDCVLIAKIDVEGGEHAVLRGMRRTIGANRCVLQIEAFTKDRSAVLDAVNELGLQTVGEIYPDIYVSNFSGLRSQ